MSSGKLKCASVEEETGRRLPRRLAAVAMTVKVLRDPRKGRHGQAWRLARVFSYKYSTGVPWEPLMFRCLSAFTLLLPVAFALNSAAQTPEASSTPSTRSATTVADFEKRLEILRRLVEASIDSFEKDLARGE